MSAPNQPLPQREADEGSSIPPLLKGAMWVAIGALIAAAILCVVWVLLSPEGNVIPRAFLTILLLAGFAGTALLDAQLAPRRAPWLVLASMASWVIALLAGLTLIWTTWPEWTAFLKVWNFVLIVGLLQLALLHQRLIWWAHRRYVTAFTRTLVLVTTVLVLALVVLAILPLALPYAIDFSDLYGRIMVSVAILAAVGTALVPLVNALFGPRRPQAAPAPGAPAPGGPQPAPAQAELRPWPTFADRVTPLPMLPNGQPDFAAAQTGVPSPGARVFGAPRPPQGAPQPPAPQQSFPAPQAAPAPQSFPHPQASAPQAPFPAADAPAQGFPAPQDAPAPQGAPAPAPPEEPVSAPTVGATDPGFAPSPAPHQGSPEPAPQEPHGGEEPAAAPSVQDAPREEAEGATPPAPPFSPLPPTPPRPES
ncbi:hypothetical protein [Microbacterium sp. gxy059]|uniref:hypothetical protein n=1 Tax=Microbacterium sp. gxy059 TaxID=2957199 RepID=UPI003D99DC31